MHWGLGTQHAWAGPVEDLEAGGGVVHARDVLVAHAGAGGRDVVAQPQLVVRAAAVVEEGVVAQRVLRQAVHLPLDPRLDEAHALWRAARAHKMKSGIAECAE